SCVVRRSVVHTGSQQTPTFKSDCKHVSSHNCGLEKPLVTRRIRAVYHRDSTDLSTSCTHRGPAFCAIHPQPSPQGGLLRAARVSRVWGRTLAPEDVGGCAYICEVCTSVLVPSRKGSRCRSRISVLLPIRGSTVTVPRIALLPMIFLPSRALWAGCC